MIIWLHGTFGAGKTTTARELVTQRPDARLWDPEFVGFMLRSQLPDLPVANFQEWPAWREIAVATGTALARQTGQVLVAPQTVLDEQYMHEIRIDASEESLRARIDLDASESEEVRQWWLQHLLPYSTARSWLRKSADLVVDTDEELPVDIAHSIAVAAWGPTLDR